MDVIKSCLGCIFSLLFILLLAGILLLWLLDTIRGLFSRDLPNTLARLFIIIALGNGLSYALWMVWAMCPCIPKDCQLSAEVFAVKRYRNKTATHKDDSWSFNLWVNASKVKSKTWTAFIQSKAIRGSFGLSSTISGIKSDKDLTLTVVADNEPGCSCMTTVHLDDPQKEEPCRFNIQPFAIEAHQNDPADPSDDTWSFQLIVDGIHPGKTGWVSSVMGQKISGSYGLPKLVKGVHSFSPITMTISDAGHSTCDTTIVISPPSQPGKWPQPAPGGSGQLDYCNSLKVCYHAQGFTVGQLDNRDIVLFYDDPADSRRQKKVFLQYYFPGSPKPKNNQFNGWTNMLPDKESCNGVAADVLRSAVVADSMRVACFLPEVSVKNQAGTSEMLMLLTFEIAAGKLVCSSVKKEKRPGDDPVFQTGGKQ